MVSSVLSNDPVPSWFWHTQSSSSVWFKLCDDENGCGNSNPPTIIWWYCWLISFIVVVVERVPLEGFVVSDSKCGDVVVDMTVSVEVKGISLLLRWSSWLSPTLDKDPSWQQLRRVSFCDWAVVATSLRQQWCCSSTIVFRLALVGGWNDDDDDDDDKVDSGVSFTTSFNCGILPILMNSSNWLEWSWSVVVVVVVVGGGTGDVWSILRKSFMACAYCTSYNSKIFCGYWPIVVRWWYNSCRTSWAHCGTDIICFPKLYKTIGYCGGCGGCEDGGGMPVWWWWLWVGSCGWWILLKQACP